MLLLGTPAGFERYFDRLAVEYAGLEPPEPSGPIVGREESPTPSEGSRRYPERGVARDELRDGHARRRRDYTYPRWRNQ